MKELSNKYSLYSFGKLEPYNILEFIYIVNNNIDLAINSFLKNDKNL